LPKAEKPAEVNTIEKYCTYCKKAGHKREDFWSLNRRPRKEQALRKRKSIKRSKYSDRNIKTEDEQVTIRERKFNV